MPLRIPVPTQEEVDIILREIHHDSHVFPEGTDEFLVFTAGAEDNEWSEWVEIEDGSGNKLSDKAVSHLHISALMVEDTNVKDKAYLIQIAHGDAKTPVTPYRFISGESKLPAIQDSRVRADHIPAEAGIYYRMKCESGGKTCDLHIRYHLH